MKLNWYRLDQAGVVAVLKSGESPTMATTMACGPLDQLIGLHDELGVFDALGEVECQRQRTGIDDELLLRTVAVLPFLEAGSLSGAALQLFREPALLNTKTFGTFPREYSPNGLRIFSRISPLTLTCLMIVAEMVPGRRLHGDRYACFAVETR